jgi:hypothetical protein
MINCAGKFNAERSDHGVKFKAPNALMQDLTPYLYVCKYYLIQQN